MSLLAQKLSSRQAAAFWYTKCRNSSRTFRPTCGHAGNLVALSQWPVGAHCVLHHSDLIVRRLNGCSAISTGSTDVVVSYNLYGAPTDQSRRWASTMWRKLPFHSATPCPASGIRQFRMYSQAAWVRPHGSVHYSINEHRPKSFRPKTRRRKTKKHLFDSVIRRIECSNKYLL